MTARERAERVAREVDETLNLCGACDRAYIAEVVERVITAAVEAEREACAATLEAFRDQGAMSIGWFGTNVIRKALDAIRARGAK